MKETEVDKDKVKPRKWGTKLAHPSYSVEPCPACEFPEAYAGTCPECGWLSSDLIGPGWDKRVRAAR